MKPPAEPPPIPSNWERLQPRRLMRMGRAADEWAQPFLERLANTRWLGQDDIDPPTAGRTVESKSQQGAYYVMLNMLAEAGIIEARKDYAPAPVAGFPATEYFWFRITKFGNAFRRWPSRLRQLFLAIVWLRRWDFWKRIASKVKWFFGLISLAVSVYHGIHTAWTVAILAFSIFVALIFSGGPSPSRLPETTDT